MALTPARIVLFLIGVFAAGGLVAYGSGVFAPRQEGTDTASLKAPTPPATPATQQPSSPAPATPQVEPAIPSLTNEPQPASEQEAAVDATSVPESEQSTRGGRITPSFDILRVEPDGSTVVAGRAKPGSTVEMMSGDIVLGQTKAGSNGDFAIALNEPLPAGDHTLVLRATSDAGSATSTEMAIVSVPSDKKGQVLAMVQEPGQPSRLISLPQAEGEKQTAANAAAQPAPATASSQEEKVASAPAETTKPETAAAAPEVPSTDPAAASVPAVAPVIPVQPAKPSQGAAAPTVEAVEIEGSMVYVAGRAAPGAKLRAYANDIFLGEATASPDGQFLVEAKRDLAVGQYTIRIDAIGSDGATVTQRAAVPFEREAGETLAAVAPSQARLSAPETPTVPTAEAQPDAGARPAAEGSAASKPGEAPEALASAAPGEATAPTLQPVKGAVIIRRGDSLWRISKRAYGRGVRYSTIYLANRDQIENPDRIFPGQVFQMPDSTSEGEKADMTRLGDQATTRD